MCCRVLLLLLLIAAGRMVAGPSVVSAVSAASAASAAQALPADASDHPNILFLAIDDMNDWVGPLGGLEDVIVSPAIRRAATPNLDRLARLGVTFTNAQTASPACNSSRAALMTGIAPATSGLYGNDISGRHFRVYDKLRYAVTLPQHLKRPDGGAALYSIKTSGKIFHSARTDLPGTVPNPGGFTEWDAFPGNGQAPLPAGVDGWRGEHNPWTLGAGGSTLRWTQMIPTLGGQTVHSPTLRQAFSDTLPDQQKALWAAAEIRGHSVSRPLFLAVGLFLPHLPWRVPVQFFERFPLAEIKPPPTFSGDLDDLTGLGARIGFTRPHRDILEHDTDRLYPGEVDLAWRLAIQAYLASIAYVDEAVGKMIDAVEVKNTDGDPSNDWTVVLWSDHGYHLGEKERWQKFTLWEQSARSLLMFWQPGLTPPGSRVEVPVDFVDLFPTIADLAGVEPPAQVQGRSLRDLLADPQSRRDNYAFTTDLATSYTVRSRRWRYIRYRDGAEELYDHFGDPNEFYNLRHGGNSDRLEQLGLEPEQVAGARAALSTALFEWSLKNHNESIYDGALPLERLTTLGRRVIDRFDGAGPLANRGWQLRRGGGEAGDLDFLLQNGRTAAAPGPRTLATRDGIALDEGEDFLLAVGLELSPAAAGAGLVFGYQNAESYYELQLSNQAASHDGVTDLSLVRRVDGNDQTLLRFEQMRRLENPAGPALDFADGLYTLVLDYSAADQILELIVQDGAGINQFHRSLRIDEAIVPGSQFGIASRSADRATVFDDFVAVAHRPADTVGPRIELSNSSLAVAEAAGEAIVEVRRIGAGKGAVSVDYTVADGNAWDGLDYDASRTTPLTGQLLWADGDVADKSIRIPIVGDQRIELDETLSVQLSQVTGSAVLGVPSTLVLTIVDDEPRLETCSAGAETLCLADGRFRVEADWRTEAGGAGSCQAVHLTSDSGYCWYFDPDNVEVVVKVLDACQPPYGQFWVFAAGLTHVETTISVLDTASGAIKRYDSPPGESFQPIQDTNAFATCP